MDQSPSVATLCGCAIINGITVGCVETTTLPRRRPVRLGFDLRRGIRICQWCPVRASPVDSTARTSEYFFTELQDV